MITNKPKNYTIDEKVEVLKLLSKKGYRKLSEELVLIKKQIDIASKHNNINALENLQMMENLHIEAIARKLNG